MVIHKLHERIDAALKLEIAKNHQDEDQLKLKLSERIPPCTVPVSASHGNT